MQDPITCRRVVILVCTCLFLLIFTARYFAQSVPLKIEEETCRLSFDANIAQAVLALENTTKTTLPVHIKLELLDQNDRVRYRVERSEILTSGKVLFSADLSKLEYKEANQAEDKLWWRLRYEITPQENIAAQINGIISASLITPDIFDLQIFASPQALAGTKYQARVRTAHPLTGNPVRDVNITALANYVLAAHALGEMARANWAVAVLRQSALDENGGLYWALETNTPFYGWGLAGRIETTALVIRALSATTNSVPPQPTGKTTQGSSAAPPVQNSTDNAASAQQQILSKGVFWLLKNKDRYGVWLSTQATINVLDAFIALNDAVPTNAAHPAEIFVNGKRVSSIMMPPANQLGNPLTVDLSQFVSAGKNQIEIKRPSNMALASAQAVARYYVPWSSSLATPAENLKPGAKRALRLAVTFDKTTAKIGETISCQVEAERIGSYGYGMLLAEIGLPPGVEVDRASLEQAVRAAGYAINRYDILPDRVILYLWPQAGGTKFDFTFKSRYGIKAVNTASVLYDYYNPEARAVVVPEKFIVN